MRPAILLAIAAATFPCRGDAAGEVVGFSLLTEDTFSANRFYRELFGWDIELSPTGAFMAVRNGIPFAGINQIRDRLPEAAESLWLAAIRVDNLAAAVDAAADAGATIHERRIQVEGYGSFALIQDPQGAPVLLVVPDGPLGGAAGYGGWEWAELWTHDTSSAIEFYAGVVGYETESVRIGEQDYMVFGRGEARHAGLMQLPNPDLAPRWAPYVGVSDLRTTLVRVWAAGGRVLLEPAQIESEVGGAERVALIADPTGAALFLYQIEERATSDPVAAARAAELSASGASDRTRRNGSANVSIHLSYGFGPGWGSAWSVRPYGPIGPPFPIYGGPW